MILQQLFILLFKLPKSYRSFSQKKSYCSSSLNKKILTGHFLFFYFFSFSPFSRQLSLSLPFFPFSFLPFSPTLSPLLKLQSRSVWSADLGLGWSSIWVSWFDWILDDFWLVLLVDWSGLMGLGDGFFELILEEEW